MKVADKGILLIALSNPWYSKWAYNLAVAIKLKSPSLHIAIVKDESFNILEEDERNIFDITIDCKEDWITGPHGVDYLKCKLHLDEITPFKKTLYIDVDMVLTIEKNISDIFDELSGIEFTIANRGLCTGNRRTEWMDLTEAKKYDVDNLYDISSEFIYFEEGCSVFKKAVEIYNENRVVVDDFDKAKPDEPYLALSMGVNNIHPHISPYAPTYWQLFYANKFHEREFIYSHYAMSFGGIGINKPALDLMTALNNHFFYASGMDKQPYPIINKKDIFRAFKENRRQLR
jgi:hypothetical protein